MAGTALPNNDGVAGFGPRNPPADVEPPSDGVAFVTLELAEDVFVVIDGPNTLFVVDCSAG